MEWTENILHQFISQASDSHNHRLFLKKYFKTNETLIEITPLVQKMCTSESHRFMLRLVSYKAEADYEVALLSHYYFGFLYSRCF